MILELSLRNGKRLGLHQGLPDGFTGPFLKHANALSATNGETELVIQEVTYEDYSIRLLVGKFLKRLNVTGRILRRGLYCYFTIKNGIQKDVGSVGKIHLKQNQFTGFFTEPTSCKTKFEKEKDFQSIDIYYSPKLLEELFTYFPELKELMKTERGVILPGQSGWSLPSMKEITSQLLNTPYDEPTGRFYFDLKVRELLFQILIHAYKRNPSDHHYTPWETGRIHEAKRILEAHIATRAPTIKSLARQIALNEYKLKTGFKQYFNLSIFDWLVEQRMQHAKELLLTTNRPVKEICVMVGYPRSSNFITAFRRRFGVTPRTIRQK